MRNLLMWAAAALMAAACLAADVHAQSAPPERLLTVDDLLGLEAFGRADISPDGRWAIYEKRAGYDTIPRVEANGRSTWAIMSLWLADLAAPASTPQALLPEEGPGLQFLAWSPSGERLVISRLRGDAFEYGIVTLSDRSVRWTGQTPDLPPNGAPAVWTGEDAVILAVRPDHSLPLLLGYDRTSTRRRAAAWERTALGVEPSRTVIEADAGILTTETAEPMQRLVSLNPRTGGTRLLAEGRIADFAVSPSGAAVALVKVYPGWADNLVRVDPLTMTYSSRPEVFVAAGYAVLSPSIPGDLPPGERGEGYARSAELAVDAALAAFPQLPADRLTLWGHSFGGYAALEIATRSSRYRSYIASSAYSDMAGVWGEFDAMGRIQPENGLFFRFNQGWTEVGQGGLGAPPWAAPDLYEASSPVWRADRITRPVLLLTADLDFTPMSQAERMFSAILRNGGKARMVTYWGEKHLIWSPANIRDYYGQIFSWLSDTLSASGDLPGPEPTAPPSGASIPPPPPPSE